MKDVAMLMLASTVFAALAWAFWHYLGDDGFTVIFLVVVLVLSADNARLRKQLRSSPHNVKAP